MSEVLIIPTEFCAPQRSQSCAINRHNQQLFDDLGGAQHDRRGYRKTEGLGGLEVHGHLKFCRQLHREIARLRAAQNAIEVRGGATVALYLVGSVGEQTAVSDKLRPRINCRYVVSGRRHYDRRAMRRHEYTRQDDKAGSRLAP